MDTLKTAVIVVLLLAVVYGAYVVLDKPDSPLPQEIAWHEQKSTEPLQIDMGTPVASSATKSDLGGTGTVGSWPTNSGSATPKSFVHGELSPEEPVVPLSEPAPIPSRESDTTYTPAGLPPSKPSGSPAPLTGESSAVAAPNLLGANPTSDAKSDTAVAPSSAPSQLPSLPSLRVSPSDTQSLTATTETSLPGDSHAQSNPLAPSSAPDTLSSTGVEATSLQDSDRDNVGPITADNVPAASGLVSAGANVTKSAVYDAVLREARLQIDGGKWQQALASLSKFIHSPDLNASQQVELFDLVDPLAAKIVYSTEHLIEPAYEVRRGDKLSDIAESYQVPWELLANINGVENPELLVPGSKLKVVRGPFRADVDLNASELTLFAGELYAGRFPISLGQDPPPKPGEYRVLEKQVGRVYYAGDGRTIPADDANNPYGRVWIGLGNDLCIHSSPEGGESGGLGCISLSPVDASDVFSILSQGSTVVIRR